MSKISKVKINGTSYDLASTSITGSTASTSAININADEYVVCTSPINSVTCNSITDTALHTYNFVFTTGSSQSGITVAMSGSETISWSSDISSGLLYSTKYVVTIEGCSTTGYIGTVSALLY